MKINDVIDELLALSLDEKYKILNTYLNMDDGECDCDDCEVEGDMPESEYEKVVDADLVAVYSDMYRFVVVGRK